MVALQTKTIKFWGFSQICRPQWVPWGRGPSENIAVLNICFDFLGIKAPSGDKSSKFKMTPHVHFISFKVIYNVGL